MRFFWAAIAVTLLLGCNPSKAESVPTSDPLACPSFLVPHQFGFEWTLLNHRVSAWENRLSPSPTDACNADALQVTVIGGDFSTGERFDDQPLITFGYQSVVQQNSETLGASRLTVEATLPPPGVLTRHLTVDRTEHHLLAYPHVHALIEGFSFRTDIAQKEDYPDNYNPAHGYTSRGLGIHLVVTEVTESAVQLQIDFRFEHGLSDREKMNAAIPHAQTAAVVDILLIGSSKAVPIRTGGVEYTLNYPLLEPLSKERFDPATLDQQRLSLSGTPGKGRGHYGWTRIDFRLAPSEDVDPDGDHGYYMRAFEAGIDLNEYDDTTGEATFMLNGYASNTSEGWSYYALNHHFTGEMAWFQWANEVEPIELQPEVQTGSTTIPLVVTR